MTARKPNPWLDAALEFGKANQSFVAIDPRSNPTSWRAWRDYFHWLNWSPYWFREIEQLHSRDANCAKSWTAPIDHPDKFTVSFKPHAEKG